MCMQCLCAVEELGTPVPGLLLVRATRSAFHMKAGDYGLVRSNDPDVVWEGTPFPDPWDGLTDDEVNAKTDSTEFSDWLTAVKPFYEATKSQLDMHTSFSLGMLCVKGGYDPEEDGWLTHWLFHRMGVMLQSKAHVQSP